MRQKKNYLLQVQHQTLPKAVISREKLIGHIRFYRMLALFSALATIALLGFAAYNYMRLDALKTKGRTTQGTIVEIIRGRERKKSNQGFSPYETKAITYRYQVNGKDYTRTDLVYSRIYRDDDGQGRGQLLGGSIKCASLAKGSSVICDRRDGYYNTVIYLPSNPAEAILKEEYDLNTLEMGLFPYFMSFIGLMLCFSLALVLPLTTTSITKAKRFYLGEKVTTSGKVIDLYKSPSSPTYSRYWMIYQFSDQTMRQETSELFYHKLTVGMNIPVQYLREDPKISRAG